MSEDNDSRSDYTRSAQQDQNSDSGEPQTGSSGDELEFVFLCKIDNARIVSNILSALQFKKDNQLATVTITRNGIKFTVEEAKSFQGNAFLQDTLFQEYKFTGEMEQFRINFSILMDCLGIYGSSSSFVALQIGYVGYGSSLILMLEENGVVSNCALKTLDAEELQNFNFRSSPILNKVIMEAEYLKDAFNELDWSSKQVRVLLSPDPPYFRLSTQGPSGSCQVDYPKDSEVFESYECSETQFNTYKLSLLQPAVKALNLSQKTQLRMNQIGILSLQHMIKNEDKNISFVDFFIAPEEETDDNDE